MTTWMGVLMRKTANDDDGHDDETDNYNHDLANNNRIILKVW